MNIFIRDINFQNKPQKQLGRSKEQKGYQSNAKFQLHNILENCFVPDISHYILCRLN